MAEDRGLAFSTLVGWLAAAHERELAQGLAKLRDENTELRLALNLQTTKATNRCRSHSPLRSHSPQRYTETFVTHSDLRKLAAARIQPLRSTTEVPPDTDTAQPCVPSPPRQAEREMPMEPSEDPFQLLPGKCEDDVDTAAFDLLETALPSKKMDDSEAEKPRTMTVNIVSARGLRNADWAIGSLSDPYVICELAQRHVDKSDNGRPKATWQTPVMDNTLDPVWNTSFHVEGFGSHDELVFKVYDKNVGFPDAFLGRTQLPSKQIRGRGFDGDLQLLDAGKGIHAYLRVRVVFDPASGEQRNHSKSSEHHHHSEGSEDLRRSTGSRLHLKHMPIRPIWQMGDDDVPVAVNLCKASTTSNAMVTSNGNEDGLASSQPTEIRTVCMSNSKMQRFISFPGSPHRMAWDLLAGGLIIYDSIVIPLQVFHISDDDNAGAGFLATMDFITLVFWTLHMLASVLVGYVRKGVTEMRPSKVLMHYMKTWFLVDLLAVVPDWIFTMKTLMSDDGANSGRSVRLLRMIRLFRTVRLIRLLKLYTIIASLHDLLTSEYSSILANILKMIMMLLFINHYLACIWFFLADMQLGLRPTWLDEHNFDSSPWEYQYFTAFHFSITQFTPASMHVQPQNVGERVFTIGVVVFALVGFSYLVGSITNSLTQLRGMSEDGVKQFWILRRYLHQNSVPIALSLRIQRYLEHAWQRKKSRISEPSLFSLLSVQLKNELQCARSLPHLLVHPLFQYLKETSDNSLHRLAVDAITWQSLARADHLFFPGEIATHVYFVVTGTLKYTKMGKDGLECVEWVDRAEDWIAEPVLWTPAWVHLGTLIAMQEADLLLVLGNKFGEIMAKTPQVHSLVSTYAANFMSWMNSVDRESLSDVSQGEIVCSQLRNFIPDVESRFSHRVSTRSTCNFGSAGERAVWKRSAEAHRHNTT